MRKARKKFVLAEDISKKYADLSWKMLVLLTGVVIFFPTISTYLKPPFIFDPLIYGFWGFAIPGLVLNFLTFYLSSVVKKKPAELAGIGNILTIVSLICFTLFLGVNLHDDVASLPVVERFDFVPLNPVPGDRIKITAHVSDQDRDQLSYKWMLHSPYRKNQLNNTLIGEKRTVFWKVPKDICLKKVDVILNVNDDRETVVSDTLSIYINQK